MLNMLSLSKLQDWLEAEDQARFPARLERLQFTVQEYGEPRYQFMTGGLIGYHAFEEARWCFVNGQFIACIILIQIVLEHMLAGLFRVTGRDDIADAGFRRLLQEALAKQFISQAEFDAFEGFRKRRNPYTYSRKPLAPDSLEKRMLENNMPYEEVFEEDAREALRMLFAILRREPYVAADAHFVRAADRRRTDGVAVGNGSALYRTEGSEQ